MLNESGRPLTPEEIRKLELEPKITSEVVEATRSEKYPIGQTIPWKTGWQGQVPLSYQIELAEDRTRAAKKLAGMRHSKRSDFDDFFNRCFTLVESGVVGTLAGAITGYILSEDHPISMTLGGAASGALGTPTVLGLGIYSVSRIKDRIYEKVMNEHKNKKKSSN